MKLSAWKCTLALCLPLSAASAEAQQVALSPLSPTTAAAYAPAPVSANPYVTLGAAPAQGRVVPVGAQEPTGAEPAVQELTPYDGALTGSCDGGCGSCGGSYAGCDGGCGSCGGCDGGCGGGCCGFGCNGCQNCGFGAGCAAFGGAAYGCGGMFGYPPGCQGWYGSLGAMVLTRDRPNAQYFSANAAVPDQQLMNGRDVTGDWNAGWEVNLGRAFCSGTAIQFTYWQLDSLEDSRNLRPGGGVFLNTPIVVDLLPDLNGENVEDYFDGSPEHRLRRSNQVLNMELNAFSTPWLSNSCGYSGIRWMAGVRWFRFDENLVFGSVAGAGAIDGGTSTGDFGDNGGDHEAYYDVRTENNLIGPQIGALGRYQLFPRLGLYATPKMGLFANQINQQQQLYTGSGIYGFDIRSNKVDVSWMTSLDMGLTYQLNRCWYAYGGYRIAAVAGIALADHQVPQFLNDTPEIERVDSNGNLLLHGATFGIGCNF